MTLIKHKVLRIAVKSILWLTGVVLFLFLLVWGVLKVPAVQNYLVTKATTYVSHKTHTRVELAYIDLEFPKAVVLQGVFLEDLNHDTLLSVSELKIDLNLLALLNNTVSVQQLSLDHAFAQLKRKDNDSTYNFQFLLDAFDSGKAPEKKSNEEPANWTIKANRVAVTACRFTMEDAYAGMFIHSALQQAIVELDDLDLQKQALVLGDVSVSGLKGNIQKTKLSESNPVDTSGGWDRVETADVHIEQTTVHYEDDLSCIDFYATIGDLQLGDSKLSLIDQVITSDGLNLSNSIATLSLEKDTTSTTVTKTKTENKDWNISLDEAALDNNAFKLDFSNMPYLTEGADWNHLSLTGVNADIRDAVYHGPVVKADIRALQVQEKSGLGIRSLTTKASMTEKEMLLSELDLKTNYSSIGQYARLRYASLDQLVETMQLDCSLEDNQLAVQDLFLVQPDLRKVEILQKNEKQKINFTVKAKGNTDKLAIRKLTVNAGNTTVLDVYGQVKHLTKPEQLYLDLLIKNIETTRLDVIALLPDSLLPSSIQLPDSMQLAGNFKGTLADFSSQVDANTSFGSAKADATLSALNTERPGYDLSLTTVNFDLGKLLNQTTVGNITVAVKAKGSGNKLETTNAEVEATIQSIRLQNYTYRSISANGILQEGLADIKALIADSNLHVTVDGHANVLEGQEVYDIDLNLRGIDFRALGYTTEQVQMSAIADVYVKGNAVNNMSGHLAVRNILLIKNGKEYKVDSLVFANLNEEGNSEATLNSSMIAASFKGNTDLFSVVPAVEKHFDKYFHFLKERPERTAPQNFSFELQLNDSPVLREVIFPSMTAYDRLHILGGFNSDSSNFWVNVELPALNYDEVNVQQFTFHIDSDVNRLRYETGWDLLKSGDIAIEKTSLSGIVAKDTASVSLTIKDTEEKDKVVLRSEFIKKAEHYRFRFLKDGLALQGNSWTVNEKNFVDFGEKYLYVNQLQLTHESQSISAQSDSNSLTVKFSEFNLHTIVQVAEQDDSLVQGIVNGDMKLKDYFTKPAFTSDLKLTNVAYKQSKVGNLNIQADNLTENRYSLKAYLTGMDNKVAVTGYYAKEGGSLNFDADIDALQLASIESFSGGQIQESRGTIKGSAKITGTLKKPEITGTLTLKQVGTRVTFLNEYLTMEEETIRIKADGVHFNSFKVKDSQNNLATINGVVLLESFSNPSFDLKITTDNFQVLNTTERNNKLYYGTIFLDSKINIKGTPQLPVITADLKVQKGSHFSFAVPESRVSTDRGEGIVVFVKDSNYFDQIMLRQGGIASADKIKGISLSAKITVDKSTSFTLLVDPFSGDSLQVFGRADLNFTLDPSGQMGLTGRYVISEGSYKATLEGFVAKKFAIIKGSKIEWYGDPLDATVDVTARYDTRVKPTSLMTIGSSLTPAEASAYSQPLPFYIYLMMKGELLKPEISFKLDMPESQKGAGGGAVYGKLNAINADEGELNKQVFSLLVFNNFMASSEAGSTGSDASDFARSSVSRLMSDQLNKLSAQYIKGVEVDVDLVSYNQSDAVTNQKQGNTQLQVGVKKTLFDDRLSVQVGGNVMLEGQQSTTDPTTTSNAQNITGDVVVEYKLTQNGRYKLRGFRLNQLDGVTNGVITQTGVGVAYTRDYNKTKELFTSKKKRQRLKKDQQEKPGIDD